MQAGIMKSMLRHPAPVFHLTHMGQPELLCNNKDGIHQGDISSPCNNVLIRRQLKAKWGLHMSLMDDVTMSSICQRFRCCSRLCLSSSEVGVSESGNRPSKNTMTLDMPRKWCGLGCPYVQSASLHSWSARQISSRVSRRKLKRPLSMEGMNNIVASCLLLQRNHHASSPDEMTCRRVWQTGPAYCLLSGLWIAKNIMD